MDDHRPLPEDLLVEILLRLPVESLLRFKCVCKHWYALIKSPSFIEKHFHHKNNRAHLFICNSRLSLESRSIEFCLLPGKIVPGVTPERKTLHQLQKFRGIVSVVGPVDGLFLVQKAYNGDKDEVSLALWNPATREFRPLPPVSFDTFFIDYDDQVALGFDLLTQDYKVVWVRVCWDRSEQGFIPRVFVSIYSLRNNLWKNQRSEFPSCCNLINSYGATYLNGVYYWLTAPLNEVCRIRSFDIGNEQFGELQGPKLSNERWVKLMLHDDSLALLLAVYPGKPMTSRYDLWVTIEEGRWTKVLTVKPLIGDHLPRAIWENDKMIFELTETSQLVLYDHTTEEVTDLGFQLDLMYGRCWVLNYKESLVSLKRGNVSQGQGQDDGLELMGDFFNPF